MIGIDAGNSLDRPPTGVAVYARNLIRALAEAQPDERFAWFYRSNRYLRSYRRRIPPNAKRRLLEEAALPLTGRNLKLFHGLNQRLPERLQVPKVATFHDLFALTGEYSTPEFRERFAGLARETADRADRIIAVSEHTAGQLEERLGVSRSRISVVHHGVEPLVLPYPWQSQETLRRIGVHRPFVLQVGSLQVRKNVERVVEAFEAAAVAVDLVLAGAPGFGGDRILQRIRSGRSRSRIRLVGHVSEEVRACLYADAVALLCPSLEEGFGLPVVEAFAAGLPVITSNVSAMPEVAGGAALLVDPLDVDAIASALERVVNNPDLQGELRQKGAERAQRFTWRRCAEETWRVYQEVLGG